MRRIADTLALTHCVNVHLGVMPRPKHKPPKPGYYFVDDGLVHLFEDRGGTMCLFAVMAELAFNDLRAMGPRLLELRRWPA